MYDILGNRYSTPTIAKIKETYRVSEEIIKNLDEVSIDQIMNGYETDVESLFDMILHNSYEVLFGNGGSGTKEIDFNYIQKLDSTINETFRIENISFFISDVLKNFNLNWYHLEWGQALMNHDRLCVLCSRDGGKSYYYSNAYPIWKMYRYRKYDPLEMYNRKDLDMSHKGYIFTNEMDLGQDLLEIVKENIESNDVLREKLYPGTSDNWSKQSIRAKNGARLSVRSYGGSFRGRHPGYVVCDDYLRENIIYSPTQRDKSNKYFFATIMNAILKMGQVIVVGTPMHELDIYGQLKTKKRWRVLEYPAIFPDGAILDPERYSYDDLMDIKEEHGTLIFSRERLVRPIISETSIFPYSFVKRSFEGMESFKLVRNRDSFGKEFMYVVVGVDLAISASAGADYCAYTVWGIDRRNDMWLMYVWRKKGASYGEQLTMMKMINTNFAVDLFCIESNQYQAVVGEGAEELGLNVHLHNTGTNKYHFKNGLPALSVMFERRKIHFPRGDEYSRNVTDLIVSEFTSVTWTDKGLEGVGGHDDMAMSTWKGYVGGKKLDSLNFGVL